MDDEEKPFDIGLFVVLLIVAAANDIAEIFFDLLDFTGVGLAGEGIMEPINLVLDAFFTAVFWKKAGFGSEVVIQLIDDFLQLFFIPGRTISVGVGMWLANHPKSLLGKAASVAAMAEGGVEGAGGELNEAEKITEETAQGATSVEGATQGGNLEAPGEKSSKTSEGQNANGENGDEENKKKAGDQPKDIMASEEEGEPVENLQNKLLEPSEDKDDDFQQAA